MSKLPETGSSLVRYLGRQKRGALRQAQSSAYVRSGISLISEGVASVDGQIQSHDFDGTDRTHLGSAGWMLGWADGLPSMLVLNGVDVYADLAAKTATLAAQAAALSTAQATLATTVSGLSTAQATLATTVTDLGTAQTNIAAQVAFLSGQSFAYSSTKAWSIGATSGTGAWEFLAYDATYDDQYIFQASSTGVLKIDISATVMLNNGSATKLGETARGYSLSWSGGFLGMTAQRSALVAGENCGLIQVAASNTAIVTVPSNATVTLQTLRAKWSPTAPDTTWHMTQSTTVIVTRVGI